MRPLRETTLPSSRERGPLVTFLPRPTDTKIRQCHLSTENLGLFTCLCNPPGAVPRTLELKCSILIKLLKVKNYSFAYDYYKQVYFL
jgi:hypothetical protein